MSARVGTSGLEEAGRLPIETPTDAIPVIAASANAMPAEMDHGPSAGFDRCLTKPLDMRQLSAAIEALLGSRP